MKLGVFAVLFSKMTLENMLDYVKESGIDTVEIGTGGYVGNAHCNPKELLADKNKLQKFKEAFDTRGIKISALSCHGNALHPNIEIANEHHTVF